MEFNSHKKVGGNFIPTSLVSKKRKKYNKQGGLSVESITDSLGGITQNITDNTKQLGENLQGHFNRFLNNPLLTKENDKPIETSLQQPLTMPENNIQQTVSSPISINSTLTGGSKNRKKNKKGKKPKTKKHIKKLPKNNTKHTRRKLKRRRK